jgi:hypothetical protein
MDGHYRSRGLHCKGKPNCFFTLAGNEHPESGGHPEGHSDENLVNQNLPPDWQKITLPAKYFS